MHTRFHHYKQQIVSQIQIALALKSPTASNVFTLIALSLFCRMYRERLRQAAVLKRSQSNI